MLVRACMRLCACVCTMCFAANMRLSHVRYEFLQGMWQVGAIEVKDELFYCAFVSSRSYFRSLMSLLVQTWASI